MTDERPDYVKCIRHTHEYYNNKSWCGKPVASFDWTFTDLDHAAYSLVDKSRLIPCPDCIKAAINVLQS